jgi:site-specific DNA recombinase
MRAAIYTRQSLDRNGEGAAVDRQERECRQLAKRNGWDVAAVYTDNDQSGTNGKRPEWRRLLADLAAGQFDVLLCWHTDRLYRRMRDLVELLDIAEAKRLRIVAVQAGDLDLGTASGRMVASMLGSVASYEVAHKAERQKAANAQRAARGEIGWSRRPYGYTFDESGRVVIVPDEAREIRKAARQVLAGATLQSIVDDLNARGVPNSLGRPWNVNGVRRVLINPRQAGRAVSLGVDYGKAPWPAILKADMFDQLVGLFADPRRLTGPGNPQPRHLLSGLTICGLCNGRMFAVPTAYKGQGRMIYRCVGAEKHLSRGLADVDRVVSETIITRLSRRDAVKLFVPDVDLDALRGHVTELRERRDGMSALVRDGLLPADVARRDLTALAKQITELERQIADATQGSPLGDTIGTKEVRATWDTLTLAQRRALIDTLAEITILPAGRGVPFDPTQVKIEWKR